MSREAATQIKEKPRATHEIPTDLNREGVTGAILELYSVSR